jgi:hypothetical protein
MAAIEAALSGAQNGGVQYWTLQDDLLGYNAWYEYNDVTGAWGVDGVRGVYGGCSVIAADFGLPQEALGGAAVGGRVGAVARLGGLTMWTERRADAVLLHFAQPTRGHGSVVVLDPHGRTVARATVQPGTACLDLECGKDGCVRGWYTASYRSSGAATHSTFLHVR